MNQFEMQIIETLSCQWFPKKIKKLISPEIFLSFMYAKSNTNANYSFMEPRNMNTTCSGDNIPIALSSSIKSGPCLR